MRVLMIGDIVGKLGRKAVKEILPNLKEEKKIDLVVANGENLAHGKGINKKTVSEVLEAGIDVLTSGNHVWDKKDKKNGDLEILEGDDPKILRPANYPPGVPGKGYRALESPEEKILIINLMGRVFMETQIDCPFRKFDEIFDAAANGVSTIIVDFHAEATAEKEAFAWYVSDRASAVFGTHTHTPTADGRILNGRMGFVTDVGKVAGRDGVIGVEKDPVIKHFLTQVPQGFTIIEEGPAVFNSVLVEIKDGKTVKVERIDREI